MKRLIFIAVFLTILSACFGCSAARMTEGDWEYEIISGYNSSNAVRITGYKPSGDPPEVLTVPDTLGGYPVWELKDYSLMDIYRTRENGEYKRVPGPKVLILPSGLKKAEAGSIRFEDLKEIRIDNGTNYETRDGVLFDSEKHILVAYPSGKTGNTYTVPEGTRVIGSNAFSYMDHPNTVILPDSVRRIEKDAFKIHQLQLTIPAGIEEIEPGAVVWASRFVSGSFRYQVINGLLVDTKEKALLSVPTPYDRDEKTWVLEIPEGVEIIAKMAIMSVSCWQVVFPSTLKKIDDSNGFFHIYSGTLVFPEGLESIGKSFGAWNLKTLIFPSTLRSIGEWCFNNSETLESVFFGEGLTLIGEDSFCRNENLTTAVLPSSLARIAPSTYKQDHPAVFDECPKLCAVVTPGSGAESFCRENMIPYRYFFDRIWQADPGEAEEAFSLSGADRVQIRMDKKSLELTYNRGASQQREVFPVQWKDGLLCMENGNMTYTLTDASHLTLVINGKELHLVRTEDR